MWMLPAPTADDAEQDLVTALTYLNGNPVFALTEQHKADLTALYVSYKLTNGLPSAELVGTPLGAEFLKAVHDSYGEVYEGRRLAPLRARLKLAAQRCPYCGFGEIKDLDHHLPRSKYRALAIFALNLVPCCHPCNSKKRAVAGENADAQFHHTYLDTLPAERFLIATAVVSQAGLIVNYAIVQSPSMDISVFQRLNFQFTRLDLNERYQAETSMFIASNRTAIETMGEIGEQPLKDFLIKSFENFRRDFGLNHWQTALWFALAANSDFCAGGYRHAFGKKEPGA